MQVSQLIYMFLLAVFGAIMWPIIGAGEKTVVDRISRQMERDRAAARERRP